MAVTSKVIACLGLLGAALVSLVNATAAMSAERDPALALQVYPGYAPAQATDLRALLTRNDPRQRKAALSLAREALTRAPVTDAPLASAGWIAVLERRPDRAEQIFTAMRKRNPRNILARVWAAQRAIDSGQYERAFDEIDVLVTLDNASAGRYVKGLAGIVHDRASHQIIRRRVQERRFWSDLFVQEVSALAPDSRLVFDLNRHSPAAQASYLNKLVAAGRMDEAFLAWLDFLPEGEVTFSWPYDGSFKAAPGAAPFNWTLEQNSTEFVPGGGMYSTYLGRGTHEIASQVILLTPGPYVLTAEMEGETRARGGALRWVIGCIGAGAPIAEIETGILTDSLSRIRRSFIVPAGCLAQRLSLRGVPGELPLWAKATTRAVAIQKDQEERVEP